MPESQLQPVSATLEQLVLEELRAHPIVVWLDRDGHYTDFVDGLATRSEPSPFPAAVVGHRGSYLETMMALAPLTEGLDAPALLLHMPHANEESIRDTPLYEVWAVQDKARFRITPETLVRRAAAGRVPPEAVDAFLERGPATLERADPWMAATIAAASGELSALLQGLRPTELLEDLFTRARVAEQLGDAGNRAQVWHYLASHLGLRDDWPLPLPRERVTTPRQVADTMIAWAMCVEYAHDLRRATVAEELDGLSALGPSALVDACREVAHHARESDPEGYAAFALDLERALGKETTTGSAADLGKIDTFRFEEEQLYEAAVDALTQRDHAAAGQWARDRLDGKSFWVEHNPTRKSAWVLVRAAAELGQAIAACPLDLAHTGSLVDATETYAEQGAAVDRLHRQLEQARDARLYRQIPRFEALRDALDGVREEHFRWADRVARQWSDLCEREGALPGTGHQQRTVFDEVVAPLLDDGVKTALVLVDGMRFEMAQELLELVGKISGSRVELRPRLAELPSVTEVGMNVLAPIAVGGKLRPVVTQRRFKGFRATGSTVSRRDDRKKAIARRAGGATCPSKELPELLEMTRTQIAQWASQARLVLVISDDIDGSGEKGVGLSVFGGALRKLHKAWRMLRAAGIRRFVFTSDHGFLLRTPEGPMLEHGKYHDALGRYALYPNAGATAEQLAISLRSLGYEGVDEYLLVPRGLQVYRPAADRTYVHGGNSPQERVIPVLTLVHKHDPGADDLRYQIASVGAGRRDGMAWVKAKVESEAQRGLSFAEADDVEVDLRVVGDPEVERHLLEVRGAARLDGDVARVRVGAPFELLFRLTGPRQARVPVELYHPSGTHTVKALCTEERFDVEVQRRRVVESVPEPEPVAPAPAEVDVAAEPASEPAPAPTPSQTAPTADWLEVYEDLNVRRVFAHLAEYGSINETDVTNILGSARRFRRFSAQFETLAQRAPFVARIEYSGPRKVYIKESDRHE